VATIALLGGSFNPPHVAHQLVALYVLETQAVDALWVVPTFVHALGKELVGFEHRLAMCRLAAAPLGARVVVSDLERVLAGQAGAATSRTFDTLTWLCHHRPDDSFRLVIGADILGETDKWHRWADVVAMAPPIVIDRAGIPSGGLPGVAMPDISSTQIRRRLRDGQAISGLLPRSVIGYIAEQGLYRDG
jgi:nicotinate-nucleotide adenylyltransferase